MHIFKNRQRLKRNNKLQNKAQSSVFVILGLILAVGTIIGYLVYNNMKTSKLEEESKNTAQLSLQADEIKKFINDCIRKTTYDGLKKLGDTGGYIDVPTLINFKGISYWHLDQINIQPFLNQTQERLLEYINANIPACVNDKKIEELGFSIQKGELKSSIEFGTADVTVRNAYPIKLSKEKFSKEFSDFFNSFDIRYRAVFEAASEINDRIFDADFDVKNPLKKMDYLKNLDFELAYKTPETDIMTFTVADKKSITPSNELYTYNFAVRIGNSELIKIIDMQNNSATNPTFLAYTIFSVDKKAQLELSSGTAVSLNGGNVKGISVQQSYPESVVAKNIPVEKENKEIKRREDLVYRIDNPVYSFEPDGLLFNKPEILTIYYDDPKGKDKKGVGILKGKNGFWVPIPSYEDRPNRKVFASILGFTDFTAVFCDGQNLKKTIARQVFEPGAGCFVGLGLFVAAIILAAVIWIAPAFIAGEGIGLTAGAAATAAGVPTVAAPATGIGGYFASMGSYLTLGAVESVGAATAIGIAFSALSLGLGVTGSATEAFYSSSPDNCQGFVPTCTWEVGIGTFKKDGEGKCIPASGTFRAGVPVTLCAQVQKCNFVQKFTCQKCSVECTAQFY